MEEEIFNATGYEMYRKENGKLSIKGVKENDIICVNTGAGSDRMRIAYIQDGRIYCEVDGIERTVALTVRDNVLLFVDITD
jgi:hypothetical protein